MELADPHRRAELRGLEAEARSKINVGVWTARIYAVNAALTTSMLFATGQPKSAIAALLVMSGLATASVRIERGNRVEAGLVTLLFIAVALVSLVLQDLGVANVVMAIAGAIGMFVGLRGVLALHRVREAYKAELMDPTEVRRSLL